MAMSTMEAEYIVLAEAAKEAVFLQKLLTSLNLASNHPININLDSEAALNNVKNNVNYPRTKHINVRYHYICEVYNNSQISLSSRTCLRSSSRYPHQATPMTRTSRCSTHSQNYNEHSNFN